MTAVVLPWPLMLALIELPAIVAFVDCWQRTPAEFPGGAPDRRAWLGWLAVGMVTVPVLVGYGIVLAYSWVVVRRGGTTPGGPPPP